MKRGIYLRTEKNRSNISKARLKMKEIRGFINSPTTRLKISNALKGKLPKNFLLIKNCQKGKTWKQQKPISEYYRKERSERISGDKNPSKRKEVRIKQSEAIIRNYKLGKYSLRPNKKEQILISIIKENNLPFNYVNGQIWFRGENHSFNPDFLSKNPKHIIEFFGDYWHNRKDRKIRDKERFETYQKYGYKTLVIWEHELENPTQVINKIKNFVS